MHSREGVAEDIQRKDGAEYFDADDDSNADRRPADKLFDEIFSKTSKE